MGLARSCARAAARVGGQARLATPGERTLRRSRTVRRPTTIWSSVSKTARDLAAVEELGRRVRSPTESGHDGLGGLGLAGTASCRARGGW